MLNIHTYQINAYLTPYFAWNWNGVKFSFLPFKFCIDPLTYITSSAVLVYISVKSFPPVCLSDLQQHQIHKSKLTIHKKKNFKVMPIYDTSGAYCIWQCNTINTLHGYLATYVLKGGVIDKKTIRHACSMH